MSAALPGGGSWPPPRRPRASGRHRRAGRLAAAVAAASVTALATAGTVSAFPASPSPSRRNDAGKDRTDSCALLPAGSSGAGMLPLAAATATGPPQLPNPFENFNLNFNFNLGEALGPALAQAAVFWLNQAGSAAQRLLDDHLRELGSGGCPATAAVLRAHLAAAAAQVATLGVATNWMLLDRAAIRRGQLWRLVTWSLVHAGPLHFLSNYAVIAKLGAQLEAVAGSDRFAAAYVASSAAATLASLALNGGRRSLGSSGAAFGLAAALWRYHAAHVDLLPPEAVAALRGVGDRALQFTAVYHLLWWSRLDVSAHFGGALAGWAAGEVLGPHYRLVRSGAAAALGPLGALLPGIGGGWVFRDRPLPLQPQSGGGGGGGGSSGGAGSGAGGGVEAGVEATSAAAAAAAARLVDASRWAAKEPRQRIAFPALGPGYTVSAAAAASQQHHQHHNH
ncbi:hypothetical protein HYH02_001720 [Chlamydomonas schloesseri]|uniref:Peptidase S54 rhomboid domain-containing protein n=1 Tax=Chlamydomonas schloesseri TaxID=2026947 RepID=A0A836BC39_9CHLO|nr:hypothetical protein HYH02_001720 [Chlamydomonas schloesseri]|eukprot:KAG2453500.1 hypothetical protein HYH02_001720 [Chlamydomonas schloesseri]